MEPLSRLPVFYALAGKRVVLAGGTPAAAWKAELLSAAGAEVWAGGVSGILYHSSDGGESWTRVVPAAAGVTLTGDIITVEFTDQQNGKLTTSHPETWTTADAGQSWQKQ